MWHPLYDSVEYNNTPTICDIPLYKSVEYTNVRSSRPEVFCKKGVLRNFTKFTGKHLCQSLFFNKVAGLAYNFIKKETLAQMFSYEFCEISKNTFFHKTPLVAASKTCQPKVGHIVIWFCVTYHYISVSCGFGRIYWKKLHFLGSALHGERTTKLSKSVSEDFRKTLWALLYYSLYFNQRNLKTMFLWYLPWYLPRLYKAKFIRVKIIPWSVALEG